jgi:hypothetical protein
MTFRIEKLKIIGSILSSKLGGVFLLMLIRRTDLEDKWDLIISAEKIVDDNLRSDIKIVLESIKSNSENILDQIADVLTLGKENNLLNTLVRTIKEEQIPEEFNDSLKLDSGIVLREVFVISLNLEKFTALEKPKVRTEKSEVVFD